MLRGSKLRAVPVFVALAVLAGCSDDDPPTGDDPCNKLVNDGPDVTPELVSAGTTPMGGTIVDGRYEQTGFEYYPDQGETLELNPRIFSGVFEFVAGKLEAVVGSSFGGDETTDRFSATYVTIDAELSLRYGCPDAGVIEHPLFTAMPTELRLFYRIADDRGTAELQLTKR